MKFLTLFCAIIVCASCGSKTSEIQGEIFVVTNAAENIKLGAITVSAIPEIDIDEHIQKSQPIVKNSNEKYKKAAADCDKYAENLKGLSIDKSFEERKVELETCYNKASEIKERIPSAYFQNLPAASSKTLTDSNGKFTLKISKPGRYAILAQAERRILNKTERYYWIVWADAEETSKQLILSNNNIIGSGSPESAAEAK